MWRRGLVLAIAMSVIIWWAQPSPTVPLLRLYPTPNTRLLVLSPHPDDETIAAAGVLQRVQSAGGHVRVVVMTSGDAFPPAVERAEPGTTADAGDLRRFGRRREQESRRAMDLLGVPPSEVTFLGFPDEGLCLLASAFLSS